MQYERTFRFSAAHFNSFESYKVAWQLAVVGGREMSTGDLLGAFSDIHGHNFKIIISIVTDEDTLDNNGWIIDDDELAEIVLDWNNVNLSMHPDFFDKRLRATTESMAYILHNKLEKKFPHKISFVRVFETDDIFAEAP